MPFPRYHKLGSAFFREFVEVSRTMGDVRLARRFGISASQARRIRLELHGPRPPLRAHALSALELRAIAACWGHVGMGDLAEALGRDINTVSKAGRYRLNLPPYRPNWRRRGAPAPPAARPQAPAGGLRWRCDCGRLVLGAAPCACGVRPGWAEA